MPHMNRKPLGIPGDRAALSVRETCQLLGISRAWAYELMRREELRSVKVGGRRLIPVQSIVEILERRGTSGSDRPRRRHHRMR